LIFKIRPLSLSLSLHRVVPDGSPEAQDAYNRNIEAIGTRIARNFEVDRFNARVVDVSAPHLAKGYDLESYRANGEIVAISEKREVGQDRFDIMRKRGRFVVFP